MSEITESHFVLNANSRLSFSGVKSCAISYAIDALSRDWEKVFGSPLRLAATGEKTDIEVTNQEGDSENESFSVSLSHDHSVLLVSGANSLGTIFGIYHVSEYILGIDPFYFWTEFIPPRQKEITLQHYKFHSPLPEFRFRGWFINGEDCLISWHDDEQISPQTWAAIYESMLRSRCNMVIPGTAIPFDQPQVKQAADMGLWIAQHHAEPLGAHMFGQKYPDLEPDPIKHKDKFETLYCEAIRGYLQNDINVIFNLGIRGQGDRPFWFDVPEYATSQAQANLIEQMIRWQKELIKRESHGRYKHFSVYVYGELAQLVQDGYLKFDDDIILIWSDNGFGAMRMRRMGEADPQVDIISLIDEKHPHNGVYYHINFHDLQASNQLTMLVKPELIFDEFAHMAVKNVKSCMILNVGNIRPHIFEIELLSKITVNGIKNANCQSYLKKHYTDFCAKHFGKHAASCAQIYTEYFNTPFCFGSRRDQMAGEELYHYAIRSMTHKCIGNAMWQYFMFTGDPDMSFEQRLAWYIEKAVSAIPRWDALLEKYNLVCADLSDRSRLFFEDNIGMQIKYCRHSNAALHITSKVIQEYLKDDSNSDHLMNCFLNITTAKIELANALQCLLQTEHGKWKNFYRGDWLTGTRMTLRFINTFRSILRIRGEQHPYESWFGTAIESSNNPGRLAVRASKKFDDDDEYARVLTDLTHAHMKSENC